MGTITTSFTIKFSAGADDGTGILKAEIDSREDGYNKGITSFVPGDSPAFLVFKSSNVKIDAIITSVGSVQPIGSGDIDVEDELVFSDSNTATPSYPIKSGSFSSQWLGADGGALTVNETLVSVPEPTTAVLSAAYKSAFTAYRLNGVPTLLGGKSSFTVAITIKGSTINA